jgi:hypothetical protein
MSFLEDGPEFFDSEYPEEDHGDVLEEVICR